jgi:WD40 repeat protein
VTSVAYNPNGSEIVSGSADRTVRVWDARTGMEKVELVPYESPTRQTQSVTSVAVSPDRSKILCGCDDNSVL